MAGGPASDGLWHNSDWQLLWTGRPGHVRSWRHGVLIAACSAFSEFFNPSRLAVLGEIVRPAHQPVASAHLQAASSTTQIVGPPVAAPLLLDFGVQWPGTVDGAAVEAA